VPFAGNPAGVCLLEAAASELWMQNIALEMNLSETAFLVSAADGFDPG
jgi:predicted PhzF superfamily epimerase YddE/YHI9